MRPKLCLAALVVVAGCGPNLKAIEVRQGKDALARGDRLVAAEHFKRACELDPKDAGVCSQARAIASAAVRETIDAGKQLVAAGRYQEALVRLVAARPVDTRGELGPVLDDLGDKLAVQCESHPLESLPDAVRFVRCLEQNRVALDRAAYSERTAKGRARAAALAAKLAEASAGQGLEGSAFAQYGVAQCLSSNPATDAGKSTHQARFYERIDVPLSLTTHFPWNAPDLAAGPFCEAVRSLSPIVSCSGARNVRAFALDVTAAVAPVTHDVASEQREIEYVDHIETYDNPDWQPLQFQLGRQRRQVLNQRRQADRDAADCETANSAWRRANSCNACNEHTWRDSTCNRADASRQDLTAQIDEENRLVSQANATPRQLQREIRDVFRFRESTHHYRQTYELTATATAEGRSQPYARNGAVEFTRVEHVGFAKAGLPSAPLVVPQAPQYRAEVVARTNDFAQTAAQAELAWRAKAKLAQCTNPRDPAQLECWLEGQALQTPDILVPYTALIAEDVGPAFPPAGCK